VVVKDDVVIGTGRNRREIGKNALAHAELEAIDEACRKLGGWRLSGCTLYVTLEPCPMCAGAMVMSQLGQCVFGAADERQGCCGSVYDLPGDEALHGVTRWRSGLLRDECAALMSDFFAKKR
jgi:tRNA(adenine34) deaminase